MAAAIARQAVKAVPYETKGNLTNSGVPVSPPCPSCMPVKAATVPSSPGISAIGPESPYGGIEQYIKDSFILEILS